MKEYDRVVRIFICDDHDILRKGLRSLLSTEEDLSLVGEASDGAEALEQIKKLRPDVILMDLLMPGTGGIEAIHRIGAVSPDSKTLVLTSSREEAMILGSLEAGARGYLLKTYSPDTLIGAIRKVARGKTFFPPEIASLAGSFVEGKWNRVVLTDRELDVLKLVGEGLSNREIAAQLHLAENTVVSHVGRILRKLSIENRTQAALYAKARGLV